MNTKKRLNFIPPYVIPKSLNQVCVRPNEYIKMFEKPQLIASSPEVWCCFISSLTHTYHPCRAYLPTFAEFLLVHVGKCRYTVNSRWIQRGIKINSPHQWCISAWICQQKWLEKGRHIPQIKWGDLVVMIYHGEKDNNHIT